MGFHFNDLTGFLRASGQNVPPAVSGGRAGFVLDAQATQHLMYVANGHVHELRWSYSKGWHHNDLNVLAPGAPFVLGTVAGYVFNGQGTLHVNYRTPQLEPGGGSHVIELCLDNKGWHHKDLTMLALGSPLAFNDPTGYAFEFFGTRHVIYQDRDGHVRELWSNGNGWRHNDLTVAAGGAPLAVGQPRGYAFEAQGTQHVIYRGDDNHVHELWWDSNGWHHNDLTSATGAPEASGDELWWDNNGIHHKDLTDETGAPRAAGDPRGYVFNAQGTQHVNYVTSDGNVIELYWVP